MHMKMNRSTNKVRGRGHCYPLRFQIVIVKLHLFFSGLCACLQGKRNRIKYRKGLITALTLESRAV